MLSTSQFSFHKETQTLSAEASELPEYRGGNSVSIKSHVTGRFVKFQYTKTVYDSSHEDIMAWEYEAVPQPGIHIKKLVIYND